MSELVQELLTAPVATLFVIAGIIFLFIAVVGNISGKIEPGVKGRVASAALGSIFVVIGLTIHFKTPRIPATSPEQIKLDQVPQAPQPPAVRETEVPNRPTVSVPRTADQEPNDHITAANFITEGRTVRGSVATNQDRDFYKFNAPSSTTRVILRKLSLPGFGATVEIYDDVENKIASETEFGDQPVTLSFESNTGSTYYIVVKSYNYK